MADTTSGSSITEEAGKMLKMITSLRPSIHCPTPKASKYTTHHTGKQWVYEELFISRQHTAVTTRFNFPLSTGR